MGLWSRFFGGEDSKQPQQSQQAQAPQAQQPMVAPKIDWEAVKQGNKRCLDGKMGRGGGPG